MPDEPLLQSCPSCATLLDVSEQEPYAEIHCPICGGAMRARTQFGHFLVEGELGHGGMGSVFRAMDLNLNRPIALKLLKREFCKDPEYIKQFEVEARITASVIHPHVVKVYSFGSDHGLFYLAMELVDKGSLDDLISLQGNVAEAQILEIGVEIAEGLQAAYQRGLIHRDVKPGNILFADAHTAKIVDFGLAILMEQGTEPGEIWGTPYYVAPEKLDNKPEDFRSDIYSLGGTLFHALAGRPPFDAEDSSIVVLKHLKSQAVSLQSFAPNVSSATAYVVNRMLKKNPDDRYQSYGELIEHLNYAKDQLQQNAAVPRQKRRVVVSGEKQQRFMGWLTMGIIVLVMVVAAFLFVFLHKSETEKKAQSAQSAQQQFSNQETSKIEQQYQQARQLLIKGSLADAEQAFQELSKSPTLKQPLKNWVTLHIGLCQLLDNHFSEAQETFSTLKNQGFFSDAPKNLKLANFFANTGGQMVNANKITSYTVKDLDTKGMGAISLLAYGLKDWQTGDFDNANFFLKKYAVASPKKPYAWTADYKSLAKPYLNDCNLYEAVTNKLKEAKTSSDFSTTLALLNENEDKLQTRGKMQNEFETLKNTLEKQQTLTAKNEATSTASNTQTQLATLAAAKKQATELWKQYRFTEASQAIQKITVSEPSATAKKKKLVAISGWLAEFKKTLIDDINQKGYLGSVQGIAIEAQGISKADEKTLDVKTTYGVAPTPWQNLAPGSVLQLANFFVKNSQSNGVAKRQWLCGVFAFEMGMPQGRDMLLAAAKADPKYRDDLTFFF